MDSSAPLQFDIAAQRLPAALIQYSQQSGVQVTSPAELLDGLQSQSVRGALPASAALEQMLQGTGLRYTVVDANTVSISKAAQAPVAVRLRLSQADTTVAQASVAQNAGPESGALQEVTVTATRREEALSRVPISVTALSQENMDQRGIKDIQDVARFTPGVKVDQGGTNNISIRGISATGGASTTGIYIDDTPIQTRGISTSSTDTLPKAFDVDRIEVLRGPQGTLFGAGSEGGTVRYITTQPSTTTSSFYSRNELGFTQGGAATYEVGVAGGVPLIDDVLGVRATLWYRRDGGWIDRVDPTTYASIESKANHAGTAVVRLAALWAVNDAWKVTPGVYYQNEQVHNNNIYWPILSNPGGNRYINADPDAAPIGDRFYLPSLKIEGDLGPVTIISNTSYFNRRLAHSSYAATVYDLGFYQTFMGQFADDGSFLPPFPLIDGNGIHLPPGLENYRSPVTQLETQRNFTQEIRLQSNDPTARLVWTTGLFFTYNKQGYLEEIHDPDLEQFTEILTGLSVEDVFGVGLGPDQTSWYVKTDSRDKQRAWYGDATINVSEQWKLTVGARYSRTSFSFDLYNDGAQLFGPPFTANPSQEQGSFTPKVNVSYQHDRDNLYYFTYAKGFRPGGGNTPIPAAACAEDFPSFGITGTPLSYDSDTTQSYEVGAKNVIANRIRLATSVYYIRWNGIQQQVYLPTCGLGFISNLGTAVAKGADLQADIAVSDNVTVELAAGYTDARYVKDSKLSDVEENPVTANGDAIEGADGRPASPFTGTIGVDLHFAAFEHEAYVRADYEFQQHAKWVGPSQDPSTLQYNPAAFTLPSSTFASLRGGLRSGSWDASVFIDNLTDSHPVRYYSFSVNPGNGTSLLEETQTYRPRTFGITVTYRK